MFLEVLYRDEVAHPGVIFHECPILAILTSEEATIDYEKEMGISISVPDNAVPAEKAIDMTILPSFFGPFAGPEGMEPVSPAYLVDIGVTQLQRVITVKIQHNASIATGQDCSDLFFLGSKLSPSNRGPLFGTLYIFQRLGGSEVSSDTESMQFGEASIKESSWLMIWRKMPGRIERGITSRLLYGKSLYSARLYKGRNKVVFCICLQFPQYTKVMQKYAAIAS